MNVKRILSEIKNFKSDEITNAFIHFDEASIKNIEVLIIGNKDTPYECGYFWFTFTYPDDYPDSPIKVLFKTTNNGKVRFNPNLYTNGKVCLSLINTWGEDDWSPANNLSSVILSIQSLVLHENPLINEPGYEKSSKKIMNDYKRYVKYYSLTVALMFLENKTGAPKEFVTISRKNFNKERFIELCSQEKQEDILHSDRYINSALIQFGKLHETILKFNAIEEEEEVDEVSVEEVVNAIEEEEVAENPRSCHICLKISDDVSKMDCCSFRSCPECLGKWQAINRSCPQCKKSIPHTKPLFNLDSEYHDGFLSIPLFPISSYSFSSYTYPPQQPYEYYTKITESIVLELKEKKLIKSIVTSFLKYQNDTSKREQIIGKTDKEIYELLKTNLSLITNNGKIFNINTCRWVYIDKDIGIKIVNSFEIKE